MLQLKSAIREMFKDQGLGDFTIGRNAKHNLAIIGPCGKQIVEVTNFPVGATLTKDQRSIAIDEYIRPTLVDHSKAILDMIKFKEKQMEAETVLADAIKAENDKPRTEALMAQTGYQGYHIFNGSVKVYITDDEDDNQVVKAIKKADDTLRIVYELDTVEAVRVNLSLGEDLEKRLAILTELYNTCITAHDEFIKAEASMLKECAL